MCLCSISTFSTRVYNFWDEIQNFNRMACSFQELVHFCRLIQLKGRRSPPPHRLRSGSARWPRCQRRPQPTIPPPRPDRRPGQAQRCAVGTSTCAEGSDWCACNARSRMGRRVATVVARRAMEASWKQVVPATRPAAQGARARTGAASVGGRRRRDCDRARRWGSDDTESH